MTDWIAEPLLVSDRAEWEDLYRGYGAFYEVEMPAAKLDLVWSWLHDPAHELSCVVIRSGPGAPPVGLAHYRPFARPLHGSIGCYLDDLFVAPLSRGSGAVDVLLGELARIAGERGWSVVRWITRASNVRARSAYDRLASATDFVTYDLPPA